MNDSPYTTIRLATVRRMPPIDAQAIPCGRFAVHVPNGAPLDTCPFPAWYAVSHVATGYQAATVQGRDRALATAEAFDRALGDADFTEADFAHPWSAHYAAWVAQAKAIAEAHA